MARIRSIKPEFWSSPSLPGDPWARLLYVAMWNWADDNGVGTAIPRELLGFAFPNDEWMTVVDLRRMLVEIRRVFGVDFYTVAGRPYYAIPSWEMHQKFDRRSKGKHPGPEEAETRLYLEEQQDSTESHESTSSPRRDSVAGTGEQGNRGTGEQRKKAPAKPDAAAPKTPEQIATTNAYERVGKAFKYVAVLQIAKWAIHDRGEDGHTVEDAIVAIYEMGKPITKQLVGQYLDGHLARPGLRPAEGGMSRADQKVQGWLDIGARLTNHHEPKGIA